MYISKLKLQGFKSFLNKTNLHFGEGVTAVVGPNGCGKSNVVDAIRWVLGEQKISSLRSSKMEDVIFNGTDTRKPIGFCEASLIVHNDTGKLPLEYTDVEITRRLYRSGESEYYINKTQCRLKDIHHLFIDTGMSYNAYSVIELKMIDTILSNNNDDRRKMFEEAAGINNYKQQKIATLKKIKSTHQDMERVNDIINEVKSNINKLEMQFSKYKKFQKLNSEKKVLDINNTNTEIQILKNEIATIEARLNKYKNLQHNTTGQMDINESLYDKYSFEYESNKKKLKDKQIEINEIENSISLANNKILVNSEKIVGNNNQIQHFNDELENINSNSNLYKSKELDLSSDLDILNKKIITLNDKLKLREKKYNDKKQDLSKSTSKIEKIKFEADSIYLKIKELESGLDQIHNNKKISLLNLNESEKKIDIINQKIENLNADLNLISLDKENSLINSKNYKKDLMILNKEQSKLQKKSLLIKEEVINYRSKLNILNERIKFYNEILINSNIIINDISDLIKDNKLSKYVLGTLSDIIKVDEKYELAVENALGEFNNCLVVKNINCTKKIIQLSSSKLSIISIDRLPKIENKSKILTHNRLLNYIKCNKNIMNLLELLIGDVIVSESVPDKDLDKYRWVSSNGQFFNNIFVYKTIGSKTKSIIGRKEKIKESKKEIKLINETINILERKIIQNEAKESEIINKLGAVSDSINKFKKEYNKLNDKENKCNFQLNDYKYQINELNKIIELNNKNINSFSLELIAFKKNIKKFRNQYDNLLADYDSRKKYLDTEEIKLNEHRQEVQDLNIKLIEFKKEEEGLIDRKEYNFSQIENIKSRRKKYIYNIKEINAENKSLDKSIINDKNKLKSLKKGLNKKLIECKNIENSYNHSYDKLQKVQMDIRERQQLKDSNQEKINNCNLKIAEFNSKIYNFKEKIKELYDIDLPDKKINLDNIDLDLQRKKISDIQKKIELIGPINLAINDEYNNEKERYDFLENQYNDLLKSENIIKQTIKELDKEAKHKFLKTFELIKKNFSKTYSSFFDGGNASINLSNPDEPLDSNIDIITQPPGKRMQSIKMLSAGEKALTAIALLFSIYLVKPSPFCILDEVDAPLDDSNITKFSKALTQFSNKTQFIVVTHNKLTMGKADYIYGISQQENGISKVVSVNLKNKNNIN